MSSRTDFWPFTAYLSNFWPLSGLFLNKESIPVTPPNQKSTSNYKLDLFSDEIETFKRCVCAGFCEYFNANKELILDTSKEVEGTQKYWNEEKKATTLYEDPVLSEKKRPSVVILKNAVLDMERPTYRLEIDKIVYEHPLYRIETNEGEYSAKKYTYELARTLTTKYGENIAQLILFGMCQGHWTKYATFIFGIKKKIQEEYSSKKTECPLNSEETFTIKIECEKDHDHITNIRFHFMGTMQFGKGLDPQIEARFKFHFDMDPNTEKVTTFIIDEACLIINKNKEIMELMEVVNNYSSNFWGIVCPFGQESPKKDMDWVHLKNASDKSIQIYAIAPSESKDCHLEPVSYSNLKKSDDLDTIPEIDLETLELKF